MREDDREGGPAGFTTGWVRSTAGLMKRSGQRAASAPVATAEMVLPSRTVIHTVHSCGAPPARLRFLLRLCHGANAEGALRTVHHTVRCFLTKTSKHGTRQTADFSSDVRRPQPTSAGEGAALDSENGAPAA